MKSTKICICGKINESDAKFCTKCGLKLDESISNLKISELTGQHKIKIKEAEEEMLKYKYFSCKVGHIHQGFDSMFGIFGTLKNGSMKFKTSRITLYDNKLLIERNKRIIEFNDIKEIFIGKITEAIIITYNDDNVALKAGHNPYILLAFKNVLSKLIEENKSNSENTPENDNNVVDSEERLDKLLELGKMYENGLLTDEEFAAMKKKLIGE